MIDSRYNFKVPFYILAATAVSFMLSLFLMQLFAAVLFLLWIFEKNIEKKKALDVFVYAVLLFGSVRILSIIFSEFPSSSIQSLWKDALFYLSFFAFVFYLKAFEKKYFILSIKVFTYSAVVVAIVGLVLFNLSIVERAQSFSSGYATFSSYLLCGLGILLFLPITGNIKYEPKINAAGVGIIITGIVTSLGRTNIAVAGLVVIYALIKGKIKITGGAIIILVVVILSAVSFYNNHSEVTQRVDNVTTLSDRDIILKGAKDLAGVHPVLGYGPRTFHDVFPYKAQLTDKGIGSWHNDFIQVYFESGIIGLLAFLVLIFLPIIKGWKYIFKKNIDELDSIAEGTITAIGALILSALTAGFIDSPVLAVVFGFLLAIMSAIFLRTQSLNTKS